jgi:septal ring factor EnvC (AmiA/AmiB activator)
MAGVKESLTAADASEPVVARERDIEADLKDLLAAMRQMPSSKGSNDDSDPNRARERELNRLVAELKMIRMVQVRVNRATVQTDGRRPAEIAAIAADLRRQIENVTNQQDDVREVTERLFTARADELFQ